MNLHALASGACSAVNPWVTASVQRSTGYTEVNYKQVPTYAEAVDLQVQRQALQFSDITQLNGMNIQGERAALYAQGVLSGAKRADGTGGDLITLPDGSKWLVALILEDWSTTSGWCKVAITRQLS